MVDPLASSVLVEACSKKKKTKKKSPTSHPQTLLWLETGCQTIFTMKVVVVSFLYCCSACSDAAVLPAIKKFVATTATIASLSLSGPLTSLATTASPTTTYSYTPIGNLATAVAAIQNNPESLSCSLDTQQADEFHGSCQQLDNVVRWRAGKVWTIKQVCCPHSPTLSLDSILPFMATFLIHLMNRIGVEVHPQVQQYGMVQIWQDGIWKIHWEKVVLLALIF